MSVHNEEKRIVEQLSAAMLTKLAVNRSKSIWTGVTQKDLSALASKEIRKLYLAIHTGNHRNILTRCADAANYLAMIADNALRVRNNHGQ